MKKVFLFTVAALFVVIMTSMTHGNSYYITNDECGKCKINSSTRKCGRCNSRMESHYLGQKGNISTGIKLYYRADCTKCNHSAIYYVK